jgi:hypothetical protein
MEVYLNGILEGTGIFSGTMRAPNAGTLRFGKWWGGDPNYLEGNIAQVRITSGVRYSQNFIPSTNLQSDSITLGFWPLDTISADTTEDFSRYGRTGTVYGATLSTDAPTLPLGVKTPRMQIPAQFNLEQNYPNPFNPTTTIHYQLPKESFVHLSIFNVLGQEVRTLINERQPPGDKYAHFDGNNLPSGVYFYRITAGTFTDVRKMVLLK